MRENRVRKKLHDGQPVLGVISAMHDPIIAETIGLIGFDFYLMDCEHGSIGQIQAEQIVRACEAVAITPLARVRDNDAKLVSQFLDSGVMGIVMPGLTSVDDVRSLVAAVKYPPLGVRGLGRVRAADYLLGSLGQADYVSFANEQTLVFPQFEDIKALGNLREMVQIEKVDGFMIGPLDLAMSMGFCDGPDHPEVKAVIDQVFDIVLGAGLALGAVAGTGEAAKALTVRGAKICVSSVQNLIATSGKSFLSRAQS